MPFTHGHALIIGIGSYQHEPRLNVPITVADAQAVATVLRDPQHGGYPAGQVTLLRDASATRVGILAALDDLAARTQPPDTVLLCYSGHGDYSADGAYHLTTHNTRLAQGKVVPDTAISQIELLAKLRAIRAERLILFINACHAGELSPVLGDSDAPFTGQGLPQQAADALLATGSGRIIITACRENQVSFIGPGPLSIFGQSLTDGLRGQGSGSRAGYLSAFDLYTQLYFAVGAAVEQCISAALKQYYGSTQEPELTVLKGVGPFAVALYRGATALGDFPTDHTPPDDTALRQVNPAHSQWAFAQSISQTVSGAGAAGIVGPVNHSPITTGSNNTVIQSGRDTSQADGTATQVDGDLVAADKSSVGPVRGSEIVMGRDASAHGLQGGDSVALTDAFAQIYAAITARSPDPCVAKDELTQMVERIEQEAQKGTTANEYKLTRWLSALAGMAEDIFAVTVAALTGPPAAFATVAHKVAAKAKHEHEQG